MDKVSRPDMKPSDLKNQLADNIVNIAKEYVDDDEKYFPLGKIVFQITSPFSSQGRTDSVLSGLDSKIRKLVPDCTVPMVVYNENIEFYRFFYI